MRYQLVKMKIALGQGKTEVCKQIFLLRSVRSFGDGLQHFCGRVIQSDWLRLAKQCAKLDILDLKARYFRRKHRILLSKVANLASEQRNLLLHKVNHVLVKSGGAGNPD